MRKNFLASITFPLLANLANIYFFVKVIMPAEGYWYWYWYTYFWIPSKTKNMTKNEVVLHGPYSNAPK